MTIGKKPVKPVTDDWKRKMLLAEHSPIRLVEYDIILEGIPYYVAMHLVRHKHGVEHFVCSQRDDRTKDTEKRADKPQGALVDMQMSCNAQALINISRKRLCGKASKETRAVWRAVEQAMRKVDHVMAEFMTPDCVYKGRCTEIDSCGYWIYKLIHNKTDKQDERTN